MKITRGFLLLALFAAWLLFPRQAGAVLYQDSTEPSNPLTEEAGIALTDQALTATAEASATGETEETEAVTPSPPTAGPTPTPTRTPTRPAGTVTIGAATPTRPAAAAEGGRISCLFEQRQVSEGAGVVLNLMAWDVRGLYAYQAELSLDPSVARVVDADPQREGINGLFKDFFTPDLIIYNTADPTAGRISLGASKSFPADPVSGSGLLAQVLLRAAGPGTLEVAFTSLTLLDQQAAPLEVDVEGCTLEILPAGEPTDAPPPAGEGREDVPPSVATAVAQVAGSLAPSETFSLTRQGELTSAARTPSPEAAEETPAAPSEAARFGRGVLYGLAAALLLGLLGLGGLWLWWRTGQ